MYELDTELAEYYRELDPKKRLELMPDDDTVRAIYENRYSDHEHKGRKNVDWWLWRSICLIQLYNRGNFFRKFKAREVASIIEELMMTSPHKNYLYHEYRNVAARYLSTCKSSGYASGFMGLRPASDEQKVIKACEDIWQMSRGIAKSSGKEQEMQTWCDALHDELMIYDDVCHEVYLRLEGGK